MTSKASPQSMPDFVSREVPWRWQERAVQWLNFPLGRFLDYGCGSCTLLEKVRHRCTECHGVDVNDDIFQAVNERHPEFTLHLVGLDGKTTYPNDYFDTVALIEVIEHVPDESQTLSEIARILKPGGRLVLTTPHAGVLTFLDIGNFKFAFPRTHRFIHLTVLGDKEYYERRFIKARDKGLVGDISVASNRKPWHRHYKPEQIVAHCPSELELQAYEVYFPAMRALMLMRTVLRVCTAGKYRGLPFPFSTIEKCLGRKRSRIGDQLVMRFVKGDSRA